MENEGRIVELLAESLIKSDQLAERVDKLTLAVERLAVAMDTGFTNLDKRLSKVEGEIVKLNLVTSQNSVSLMKPVDHYDERFNRIEKVVFKS